MTNGLLIAVGILVLLSVSLELGFRAGRRTIEDGDTRAGSQVGAIQGALLGLLGLLLAFSFAAAGARFLERQDLILQEANAIGTASLRADLLDEPYRGTLRGVLRRYTEHRISLSANLQSGLPEGAEREIDRMQGEMWRAARDGVAAKPGVMMGVLPPVNEVIDLHATRLAAGYKHVPSLVMGLLVSCSALAIGVIGYACGLGRRRRVPLTMSLAVLVGAALWITIDLDHPRAGLLILNDAPLKALRFD